MMNSMFVLAPLFSFWVLVADGIESSDFVARSNYLSDVKTELEKEWPNNRVINLVFHGHSVPSGYFKTPVVNTLEAYPMGVLKKIKKKYPYAVVNAIVTCVGGEDSAQGEIRFEEDVLTHKPDVLFIDYGLNDRRLKLEESYAAWSSMIVKALEQNIKVILLTPSPDQRVDYQNPGNSLKQQADQITSIAKEHQIGLVDSFELFSFLYEDKARMKEYMSQVNHPNAMGHELITNEIIRWF